MSKQYSASVLPQQKLSIKQKGKEWQEANVDYIIGSSNSNRYFANNGRTSYEEMQINYDLYNGIFNEEDLRYVTDPYNVADGFPATLKDFNIIRPKLDLLIGEETKRPFNFTVTRTSTQAASEIQDRAKGMIMDYLMGMVMSKMSPEQAQEFQEKLQSGEIQPPEQIQQYLQRDFKDVAEIAANHTLNFLYKKLNIPHENVKAWKDLLIAPEEVINVGVRGNDLVYRRVNPMHFSYELSPDIEFIDEAGWCCEHMRLSHTEIYDLLYDKMDNADLDKLLEKVDNGTGRGWPVGASGLDNYNPVSTRIFNNPTEFPYAGESNLLDIWYVCWRSYRRVGFVTTVDPETMETDEFVVDETYVETGSEASVDWQWVEEIWEGYRITDDLYVGVQPLENAFISAEHPNARRLPYTGLVYSNTNSRPRSLVSIMKPLQYQYIILWYRLELAIARDKGKILNMDITQIPKSFDIDFPRWAHMLQSIGINLINPYEDGWDIPGRAGGHAAAFNQISSVDLTMSNAIAQYIELMLKIEDMVGEISGVSKQRQGSIQQNELVGNVDRSVVQSSHITEPLFWAHNQVKRRALTMLLDSAKALWSSTDKEYLHYIMDDGTRAFMQIPTSFYDDMDIFVTDATEDMLRIQQLQSLYQPAMQNGASLLDIAEIMTLKNLDMIKAKLSEIDQRNQARMEQAQQAEQQAAVQIEEMKQQAQQLQLAMEQAKLDLEKYKTDQDNITKITVAEIGAYRYQQELDANQNGIPDPIEIAALGIDELAAQSKANDDVAKAKLKDKEIETKKAIEEKKIALEEKKLSAAKQLQAQKDAAALEREQIKARTALKNKVAGQK